MENEEITREKNEPETENENTENLNNSYAVKPAERIKKRVGTIAVIGLSILFLFAFYKASFPTKKSKQQVEKEGTKDKVSAEYNDEKNQNIQNEMSNLELTDDYSQLIELEKAKNKKQQNSANLKSKETELSEMKNIHTVKVSNPRYEKYLEEEEKARESKISWSSKKETGEDSKESYPNNQNNSPITQGEDPNLVRIKKEFAKNPPDSPNYNKYLLENSLTKYEVKVGSIIPAILGTGINSDLPGTIIATVREDIYDTVSGNYLLIPKGSRLKGVYDNAIAFGQSRVMCVWQRIVFPNGQTINLDKFGGVDMSGYAGVTGKVNNHTSKMFQAVVLSAILGAGAGAIDDNNEEDWQGSASSGAGEQIMQFGTNYANKVLGVQPTIEIPPATRFNIIVESDLILTPYKKK